MQATMPQWTPDDQSTRCQSARMTSGGVLVLLFLLVLAALAAATVAVAVRGGRGPADPPASHARVDLHGFPVSPTPRGVLPARRGRASQRRPRVPARSPRRAPFRLRSAGQVPMHR
jgi:hypothetical protein